MAATRKRVTIKDVGREAGVSWTTVSRVLTGGSFADRISPETRSRIHSAARRLSYRPNAAGVALKRGYSNTLALLTVTMDLATTHLRAIARLTRLAQQQGLNTLVNIAIDDEGCALVDKVQTFNPYGMLLIWDSDNIPLDTLNALHNEGVPIVDLMPHTPGGPVSVTWDRQQGFQTGVEHLVKLGHRRIGVIRRTTGRTRTTNMKMAGWRLGMKAADIECDEDLVQECQGEEFQDGYEAFSRLYCRRPDDSRNVHERSRGSGSDSRSKGARCQGAGRSVHHGVWRTQRLAVGSTQADDDRRHSHSSGRESCPVSNANAPGIRLRCRKHLRPDGAHDR